MVRNSTPNRRLNGLYPLAYLGDNPTTPADSYSLDRDPTPNDYNGFYLMDMWLNTLTKDVWILVAVAGAVATWVKFTSGFGDVEKVLTDSGTAVPVLGQIDLFATPTAGSTTSFSVTAPNIIKLNVTDALHNTIVGASAGNGALTGVGNSGFGYTVLSALTSGANNFAAGFYAMKDATSASNNVLIGYQAGVTLTTSTNSVGVGTNALSTLLTGTDDVGIGTNAGSNYAGSESWNTIVGSNNTGLVGEIGVTRIGAVDSGNTSNTLNTFIGYNSGNNSYALNTCQFNTFAGSFTGQAITTARANTSVGHASLQSLVSGSDCTAMGYIAGNLATGSNGTFIGAGAGNKVTSGSNNTLIGYLAGTNYVSTEAFNVIVGNQSAKVGEIGVTRIGAVDGGNTGNNSNTFIGYNAGNGNYTLASATGNTCIGAFSGQQITTGDGNCLAGQASGTLITTGSNNCGYGPNSFAASFLAGLTTGSNNCAFGQDTLYQIVSGSNNCAFGDSAGSSLTGSDSNNIMINISGTAGDNNTMRIANGTGAGAQQLNKTFISGIQTIGIVGTPVLVSATDQLGVAVSSRKYKDNIEDMASSSDDLMRLRPVTFNYKFDEAKTKSFGLIAEEVAEIMPDLVVYDKLGDPLTVKYHDLPALLLNEIQKLNKRIEALEAR